MVNLYILNGPDIGQCFNLRDGVMFAGRSLDNDVRIDDKTVSRKHLRIVNRGGKFLITDLKSRNGTFYDGKYLVPGRETEIEEGVPLAIGIRVICLGEGCREQMAPFLDTASLIRESGKEGGNFKDRRRRTSQKRLGLLSNVAIALKTTSAVNEALEKVLDHIFYFLGRIDRGAFLLVDPVTLRIKESICKTNRPGAVTIPPYCEKAIHKTVKTRKPMVYSTGYTANEKGLVDTLKVLKIESVMCIPLISGSKIMGAMYIDSLERPDGFRKDDLLLLLDISQRVALAIEQIRFASETSEIVKNLLGED
jgi:pSer/pThr/pTyr-binding forkhead associated (FHA) protein